MTVKVGDKLLNNDPRENGAVVEVVSVDLVDRVAFYKKGKRAYGIKFGRIYEDGKSRRQGYNLVKDAAATTMAALEQARA